MIDAANPTLKRAGYILVAYGIIDFVVAIGTAASIKLNRNTSNSTMRKIDPQ
jgi:hypothetical protein